MFDDAIARINDAIDRHRWRVLAGASAAFLAMTLVRAYATPFGHDEVYTILTSQLPSQTSMWTALDDGLDVMPPLFALAARGLHAVVGVGPFATRVPAILGVWVAAVVLFVLVRRRSTPLLGVAAALLLCFTAASRDAIEARGYGVAVGCVAVALYAWTEAAAGRRRPRHLVMLTLALGAAVWAQYHAALAFLPIVAGEAARASRAGRPDWPIAAAIAAAAAITLPLAPLAETAWRLNADPLVTLRAIVDAYAFLLAPLGQWLLIGAIVVVVGIALVTIAGALGHQDVDIDTSRMPWHELVAGALLVLLPAIGMLSGVVFGGVAPRDMVFAAPGLAAVVPVLIYRLTPRSGLADVVFAGALAASFLGSVTASFLPGAFAFPHPIRSRPALVRALEDRNQPVVIAGGVPSLPLLYYAAKDWPDRAAILADPTLARELTGSDRIDRGYVALGTWTPAAIESFYPYIAIHRTFLLYEAGSDWLVAKLRQQRAIVEEIEREPGGTLFSVRLRSP